jgi:hypothetical protein
MREGERERERKEQQLAQKFDLFIVLEIISCLLAVMV